jgi:hypothetical protein
MRYTPEIIDHLEPNEVFVFGSNLAGIHGAGAAKDALKFGAVKMQGEGHFGQTYALPTKSYNYKITLSLDQIAGHVSKFIEYAISHPQLTFLVTPIGCGLAGYSPNEIAPLFREVVRNDNIILPISFVQEIERIE